MLSKRPTLNAGDAKQVTGLGASGALSNACLKAPIYQSITEHSLHCSFVLLSAVSGYALLCRRYMTGSPLSPEIVGPRIKPNWHQMKHEKDLS